MSLIAAIEIHDSISMHSVSDLSDLVHDSFSKKQMNSLHLDIIRLFLVQSTISTTEIIQYQSDHSS